jgi:DNA-binding CsgD family transcriptional regulator
MIENLIDLIYEAAFVPELWPKVLDDIAALSGSASGATLAITNQMPVRKAGSETLDQLLPGSVIDILPNPPAVPGRIGYSSSSGALVSLTNDAAAAIVGSELVESLRPHLERAGLIAARLGKDRAHTTVKTLEAIGLPAAVLGEGGQVLDANSLIATLTSVVRTGVRGGLSFSDPAADALYQKAILQMARATASVNVIPIAPRPGRLGMVVHLVPRQAARGSVMTDARFLLVITTLGMTAKAPDIQVLIGLFDLSPAEARLAASLSSGRPLKDAAADNNIRFSTARSYLERIFIKTRTNQQSQLVALLRSASSLAR